MSAEHTYMHVDIMIGPILVQVTQAARGVWGLSWSSAGDSPERKLVQIRLASCGLDVPFGRYPWKG